MIEYVIKTQCGNPILANVVKLSYGDYWKVSFKSKSGEFRGISIIPKSTIPREEDCVKASNFILHCGRCGAIIEKGLTCPKCIPLGVG